MRSIAASGAAFRLNVMGQEGGVAGRDFIERESWGVAPVFRARPRHAPRASTRTRSTFSRTTRRTAPCPTIGVADYANPALDAAGIDAPRVDDEKFYGLTQRLREHPGRTCSRCASSTISRTNSTLRNTARYGRSEQERVLTAPLQAPIVVDGTIVRTDPSTWTLGRTRQASFRENEILTNQTNITAKFATGGIQHSLSNGVEFIYEKQFTPTHRRPRHARADEPLQPGPQRRVHRGAEHRAQRRVHATATPSPARCTRSTRGS